MIYYVATTGLDTAVGSMEAPFRTINRDAQVAHSGDTVRVFGGVIVQVHFEKYDKKDLEKL